MESQVLEALKALIPPEKIRHMYETYANGFESLKELIKKQTTQRTMSLLANNSGIMSKEIILVALSLNDSGEIDSVVYEDLTADPSLVVRFCKHLVRINERLGVFEFCHKTVFEVFSDFKLALYNRRIAELCLSHMCSSEFSQGPRNDAAWFNPGSLAPVLRQHPFLSFACSKWAISIKRSLQPGIDLDVSESHSTVLNSLEILFRQDNSGENRENLQLAFQVYLLSLGKRIPKGVCHDHIVCYFGLFKLFDVFIERQWLDVNKVDDDGLLPIHWAIRNEFEPGDVQSTVRRLLKNGASVNVKDKDGRTPLYYACHYGNLQVVQLLVSKHAQLNDINKERETALIAACRKHRHNIVPYLVKAGSDVKIQSSFGTALQAISLIGCCICAEVILDGYGNLKFTESDGPFGTSLHAAAFNGHAELVKLLCSRLPNTRATNPTYGTPLTAAATGFNPGMNSAPFKEIIEELIKYGINVNDRSGLVGPALRAAAYQGGEELVRLLLEKGAKIRKAKGPMGTAYEGAAERGHQNIIDILLKHDPKAKQYSVSHAAKPLERQKIQRKVFRATVKTSSMDTLDSLVTQFEKFFEREIKIGDTAFLRTLAKLGEDAFQDVIILATKSRDEANIPTETNKQNADISRLREIMSTLCCIGSTDDEDEPTLERTQSVEESPYIRRASTSFAQDGLGEHFPQVLDRMTQAAVKILEDAIASENRKVIVLITNTWVKALNDLVSYPGFGEPMLEMFVKRRADELKEHLINTDLTQEERFRKATALAQVGIELLLMAVERGPKFRHLCFVISKLWIRAVSDVEELGKEGELPLQEMIRIFAERFSSAVAVGDSVNAEICAQAGIELLRAAALIPKFTLLERFGSEWAKLWALALEKKGSMAYMASELILRRQEEYQECLQDKTKYDKAIGLSLASLGMLREAFEQRSDLQRSDLQRSELVVASLLPIIESNLGLTQNSRTSDGTPAEMDIYTRDQESLLNTFIKLLATGEKIHAGRLNNLACGILALLKAASDDRHQKLVSAMRRRIDEADRLTDRDERMRQLMRICRTLLVLLDNALIAEERNIAIVSRLNEALRYLAKSLPSFTDKVELAQYITAIEYLNSTHEEAIG
jgi:ankyrin repeat protein